MEFAILQEPIWQTILWKGVVFLEDGGKVPKLGEQECVNNPFPLNIFGVSNVSAYVCVTFSDVVASLKQT